METEGLLETAMLKGYLWMSEDAEDSEEGARDEASQQAILRLQGFSTSKAYGEKAHLSVFLF